MIDRNSGLAFPSNLRALSFLPSNPDHLIPNPMVSSTIPGRTSRSAKSNLDQFLKRGRSFNLKSSSSSASSCSHSTISTLSSSSRSTQTPKPSLKSNKYTISSRQFNLQAGLSSQKRLPFNTSTSRANGPLGSLKENQSRGFRTSAGE